MTLAGNNPFDIALRALTDRYAVQTKPNPQYRLREALTASVNDAAYNEPRMLALNVDELAALPCRDRETGDAVTFGQIATVVVEGLLAAGLVHPGIEG